MNLEKALRWVVLAGVFLLPFLVLYVSRSLFFPFITGKNFAFRIIVEIISGGYLALAFAYPAYRPKRTWLLWAFAAFVGIMALADLFGTYPLKSFWSNYERMEGWITLAHLFAYFVVMGAMLRTKELWHRWWHTSLGVSGLVSVYALLQLAGLITINQGGIRLDATFGNATYLGVYMLFHISMTALLLAREYRGEIEIVKTNFYYLVAGALQIPAAILAATDVGGGNGFIAFLIFSAGIWTYAWARASRPAMARAALIVLMLFQAVALFFTSTRGAILGLVGAGVLAGLIMVIQERQTRLARGVLAALIGLVVIVGIFALVKDQQWVKDIEPLWRLSTTLTDGTTFSRLMNWGMAWEGFKERPILGWGQENYAAVFDKYYDPGMWGQEPWFDRVHNIVFDWLIAGGILGLLAYLSLHVVALWMLWRSALFAAYEKAILSGLFAGYFFYLLFTFDNLTSYLFFVATLAYIATRTTENDAASASPANPTILPWVAGGAILIVWLVAWFVNADAIAQNRLVIRALSPQNAGPTQNLEYFKQAAAMRGVGTQEAREQFSQAAIAVVGAQNIDASLKEGFVKGAFDAMTAQQADAPRNARFPFFLGILFDHSGLYADAKTQLDRAHELSPNKQSILYELGLNAFARGVNDEAVGYFKQAYELATENIDAKKYYVAALIRAGKDTEAEPLLRELVDSDAATDPRIAQALASRGMYAAVAEIWRMHTAKHPEDVEARFVLVGAYYQAGARAQALAELEAIKREHPAAAEQADQFIADIEKGVTP